MVVGIISMASKEVEQPLMLTHLPKKWLNNEGDAFHFLN